MTTIDLHDLAAEIAALTPAEARALLDTDCYTRSLRFPGVPCADLLPLLTERANG